MKKNLLLAVFAALATLAAGAQSYDKVSLSYNHLKLASELTIGDVVKKSEATGLNGIGINYIHGAIIRPNICLESGLNAAFLTGSANNTTTQNLYAAIPLNIVYCFPITEGVTIDTYAGLSGKYNAVTRSRIGDGKWESHFTDSDLTNYNRLQVGWQVGLRVCYDQFFIGAEYDSDIIPAFSYRSTVFGIHHNTIVDSYGVKVSVGLNF